MKKSLIVIVLIGVCMISANPDKRLPDSFYYAEQNNKFAFDLYQNITEKTKGNIFFSPYSISSALAMTYAGASSITELEMGQTLHFDVNRPFFHHGFNTYSTQLLKNAKGNVELAVANQLWGEKTYELKEDFVNINRTAYNAALKPMDFKNEPEKERLEINNWVASQTNGRINDLLPKNSITIDTRLVLTNAIYFKADWLKAFDEKKTKDSVFKQSETQKKETPFMHSLSFLRYFENNQFQMIGIPYRGNKQSMIVVLPKNGNKMTNVEKSINTSFLTKIGSSSMKQVDLALPKFKLTLDLGLNTHLKDLGMNEAFSTHADFSKMTPTNDLWISDVVHKAFIEIDEKGSEAAAATAIVMAIESMAPSNSPQPKVFTADHPFLIYIIDNETKAILFMGRIVDPKSK